MVLITTIVVIGCFAYTLALFLRSRQRRAGALPAPDDLFFVFLVPCLDEELVIGASLDRLAALEGGEHAVLVIDDGSSDRTAEIVRGRADPRVWLLSRQLPEARQGKGRALNAALRHLLESDLLAGRDPRKVIVAVLDADGRMSPGSLFEVAPYFADPQVGAVQVGVRMYNREDGLLPRLQDFEFVTFTEIFQRARQRLGSVGLGGNGQFTRLTALTSLGTDPWSDCLTEDLDLGLRLTVAGWTNGFCPTAYVAQQAVTDLRRLLRQRTRWFQGHLQCWSRLPMVLRAPLASRTTFDLVFHVTSPALVLAVTFAVVGTVTAVLTALVTSPSAVLSALTARGGLGLALSYLLTFGVAPLYGSVYWLRDRELSLVRAMAVAHAFTLYSYLWIPAGWRAVWRIVTGQRGWAKTARVPEAGDVTTPG